MAFVWGRLIWRWNPATFTGGEETTAAGNPHSLQSLPGSALRHRGEFKDYQPVCFIFSKTSQPTFSQILRLGNISVYAETPTDVMRS